MDSMTDPWSPFTDQDVLEDFTFGSGSIPPLPPTFEATEHIYRLDDSDDVAATVGAFVTQTLRDAPESSEPVR
jgi:hypothetical protein